MFRWSKGRGPLATFFLIMLDFSLTSFFWLLFVFTFALIWLFHFLIPVAEFVYLQISQSDRPASSISAFLNGFLILAYLPMDYPWVDGQLRGSQALS